MEVRMPLRHCAALPARRPVSGASVLLADEQPLFRAGVRAALESDGFVVCDEADDASATIEAARRQQPALCLVDLDLPGGGGIDVLAAMAGAAPGTRVVLLAANRDDQ